MAIEVLNVTSEQNQRESVRKAGEVLRSGGLVVLPTETVYGIAASADNSDAVARLRALKGQRSHEPFTVHIGRRSEAERFLNRTSGFERRLIARGWPGPLTLVFDVPDPGRSPIMEGRDAAFISRVYYSDPAGGGTTIGLRYPDCPVTCDTINQSECVVVASSANRSGQPPPTDAEGVLAQLADDVDLLLDGGPTKYGGASTIARVRDHRTEIIRQGVLEERTLRKLATTNILLVCTGNTCRSPMAAGLLKALLAEALGIGVSELENNGYRTSAAGTATVSGLPATSEAIAVMKEKGIDISDHRSTALTHEMVEQAQVILTMTRGHRAAVLRLGSGNDERCHLVSEDRDIADPIGGDLAVYKSCRDQIEEGLRARLREVIL